MSFWLHIQSLVDGFSVLVWHVLQRQTDFCITKQRLNNILIILSKCYVHSFNFKNICNLARHNCKTLWWWNRNIEISRGIYYIEDIVVIYTYLLTPWCKVLLEELTGLQLVNKFLAFHGTRRFITALTSVRLLSLSWASPIQSIYPHHTSWRFILIVSTHLGLGLPIGLLPFGFPSKTLYTPLSSTISATCPAHLILLDFITRTILGEEYRCCDI